MSTFYVANGNENKKLLFVGFDDFTAIEYSIIERNDFHSYISVAFTFFDESFGVFVDEIFTIFFRCDTFENLFCDIFNIRKERDIKPVAREFFFHIQSPETVGEIIVFHRSESLYVTEAAVMVSE